ncbi:MAG: HAD family phosphatase [Planctomycetes bacterium]|nr:HAD family phosphatase [Planctomycetota bacterium]
MAAADRRDSGVVFDLDGVLVDSEGLHVEAWRRLFAERGVELTDEEYAQGVGMSDADWLAWLFARRGTAGDVAWWREAKRQLFQALLAADVRPFPGVVGLVRTLRPRFRLGVASNSWRRNIETVLDALGIRGCFDAWVGADDVTRCKPHPDVYELAAARLALPSTACVVIEDSPLGIQAARAAGMRCIGITNSMPAERLAQADLVVSSLEDAGAILGFLDR